MVANKFFIVVGPSGSGKGSICHGVLQQDPQVSFVTTCVTREPRVGEVDGVSYHFLSKAAFQAGIEAEDFVEYDAHYDNFYGTRKKELDAVFAQGKDALTDLNWAGVEQVQDKLGKVQDGGAVVPILIMPPSFTVLAERLQKRTAAGGRPLSAERLEKVKYDFEHMDDPDYVFTNPDMIGSRLADYVAIIENDTLAHAVTGLLDVIARYRA